MEVAPVYVSAENEPMKKFTYYSLPIDVHFGENEAFRLEDILLNHGYTKPLIITTSNQKKLGASLTKRWNRISFEIYPHATMHVPIEVANQAISYVINSNVDCCLAVGGGSAIGLAKIIALKTQIPIIAIPTTYSGSEMTAIYGFTKDNIKTTGRSTDVIPKLVVYDPSLTLNLPSKTSVCSGMNAMAHAIEALYAEHKNPLISLIAIDSIKSLQLSLPIIAKDPKNKAARYKSLYGAWLAGICLGSVGMALHHKICHALGGMYNLPHAHTHAIILAHSVHYNCEADTEAIDKLVRLFGVDSPQDVGMFIYNFILSLDIDPKLRNIGFPEDGSKNIAKAICTAPSYNPRKYEFDEIQLLLQKAYNGLPP